MIPKISIITVVYNDVRNIKKTINNVLKQDYPNIEYIIIDGASTDGTLDIITSYSDQGVKYISEPDKGLYDAMNKGAKLATGEWLIYRNSGDYFYSHNTISDVFRNYIDNNESIIAGRLRFFKQDCYRDVFNSYPSISMWEDMPFLHPATFIRRSVQLQHPYDIKYRNSADYKFFLEILNCNHKYLIIDDIIGLFSMIDGATANHYDRTLLNNIDILKEMHADNKYIYRYERSLALNNWYILLSKFFKICFPYLKRRRMLKQGWIESPLYKTLENV